MCTHLGEVLNVLQHDGLILGELLVDVGVLAAALVVGHVAREEVGEGDGRRPIACMYEPVAMSQQIANLITFCRSGIKDSCRLCVG